MMDEIYSRKTDGIEYVVRLSRTAQGVRTYTVGASIPDAEYRDDAVSRLFDLERAVVAEIDGNGSASARRSGNSLTAQMRRTMVLNRLRQTGGWETTAEILAGVGAAVRSRSQLVADLSALVRDGLVEKEEGGQGRGKHSRYRLASK
jgi:hypothetical protein